jgi:hypothetical protein
MIVNDIIVMLDGISKEMNSSETLFYFLQEYSELPLDINGIMVHLSIKNARSKININILKKDKVFIQKL